MNDQLLKFVNIHKYHQQKRLLQAFGADCENMLTCSLLSLAEQNKPEARTLTKKSVRPKSKNGKAVFRKL